MPSVVGIILFIYLLLYFVHAVFGFHVYSVYCMHKYCWVIIISNIINIHAHILYTQRVSCILTGVPYSVQDEKRI